MQAAGKPEKRARVKRGDAADQAQLVLEAVEIAARLFEEGGVDAVSMRAVTREMALSPTALYNYFGDKSDLLRALWSRVISSLHDELCTAQAGAANARDALSAITEAFFDFYEARPNYWMLLYMTPQTLAPSAPSRWLDDAVYLDYIEFARNQLRTLARELGGSEDRVQPAIDLWTTLLAGYLHSRIANRRYPWSNLPLLRAQLVRAIDSSVCDCLCARP